MNTAEIKKLTDAEIVETVETLRKRLFELKSKSAVEQIDNPSELGKIRKDIARLLTQQRERELAGANN